MPRRKKRHEEVLNHERWIISYADFITLLFAFFVVMYSISSVNEGKYRVLSQTLTDAFQEPTRSLDPVQIGELGRKQGDIASIDSGSALIDMHDRQGPGLYNQDGSDLQTTEISTTSSSEQQRLSYLAVSIEDMLEPYVEKDLVEVNVDSNRVTVDMKDKMLFPSGSTHLSRDAVKVLRDLSRILSSMPNQLQVEGNTDNRPIRTEEFPSNWELSAARAASVVHLMTRMGVDPSRLSAIGYGEYRPVANNDTEEGRQKNRRVTLVVKGLDDSADRTLTLPGGAP
ncbi:MAG: flagellar motor protein MotD [Pseudomonadota bacterium]